MSNSRKCLCKIVLILWYYTDHCSAGGGGNTSDRKAKIQGKNERLNEQRVRRMQEEEKTKATKSGAAALDENSIHPSRRTRVPV